MTRLPRIVVAQQTLHIIQRGSNRHVVFFADDGYRRYLADLEMAARRCDCAVRAGMVQHPSEYRWFSYRHSAAGATDTDLSEHQLYRSLGTPPRGDDRKNEAFKQQQKPQMEGRGRRFHRPYPAGG